MVACQVARQSALPFRIRHYIGRENISEKHWETKEKKQVKETEQNEDIKVTDNPPDFPSLSSIRKIPVSFSCISSEYLPVPNVDFVPAFLTMKAKAIALLEHNIKLGPK